MKYAIIAAGEGSRLAQEGIDVPKPLVKIHGEHLIDRLIRIFTMNEAEEIVVICNDLTTEVSEHLRRLQNAGELCGNPLPPLRFVVKTTPSSMHSFYELSRLLAENDKPFVLTTVDTIFREAEFKDYICAFKQMLAEGEDGLMGVTAFIDDEKPLYVGCEGTEVRRCGGAEVRGCEGTEVRRCEERFPRITGFYDSLEDLNTHHPSPDTHHPSTTTHHPSPVTHHPSPVTHHPSPDTVISAGIYGLTPRAFRTLNDCIGRGESRMRNFQRALVADGLKLRAYPFQKVLDIDHATDIQKAEEELKNEKLKE